MRRWYDVVVVAVFVVLAVALLVPLGLVAGHGYSPRRRPGARPRRR